MRSRLLDKLRKKKEASAPNNNDANHATDGDAECVTDGGTGGVNNNNQEGSPPSA